MDPRVAKLKTAADCESFERNALKLQEEGLAQQARRRKVELNALAYGSNTQAERECLEAIYAYEETLRAKNGKRTRATRTWEMVKRRGIVPTVERTVIRPSETVGFRALAEMGLDNFAFEAVILRHPEHFSKDALEAARKRMADND